MIFCSVVATGQKVKLLDNFSDKEQRAENYFAQYKYREASELFSEVYRRDTTRKEIALKTAECYRMINDYLDAEVWYNTGIGQNEDVDPIYLLHYAQALTNNEHYDEAKIWFHKYSEMKAHDTRAQKKIATLDQLHFHFKDSQAVVLTPVNINSDHADWAPARYGNKLVFLSGRGNSDKFKNVLNWKVESYTDMYITHENEDGTMTEPEKFHPDLNSKFHEGPMVFYGDHNIIFTQNESDGHKGDGGHLVLYSAKLDPETNEFENLRKLSFCKGTTSYAHPAISPDGQVLYFASNLKGGYGNSDLYKSEWTSKGWGKPINLGPVINSEGNESFPYVMNEDELVFSSDGHGGLGGRDLFRVDLSQENLVLENLGFPFNSSKDDFGYTSNELGSEGFLTSNRKRGGEDDDIYKFRVIWVAIEFVVVDDETGSLIKEAEIKVFKEGRLTDTRATNENGIMDFVAMPGEKYEFEVIKKGYESHKYRLGTVLQDAGTLKEVDVVLKRDRSVLKEAEEDTTDFKRYSKYYNKERLVLTVGDQVYEYRELGDYKYLVAGEEKIMLDKIAMDAEMSMKERAIEVVTASGMQVGETFELSNIYFDRDDESFMEKYKPQLDQAVAILKASPRIKLEINAFSDSRGTIAENNELTFKRAQMVARYFMSKGVQGSRFFINGYGEQGILNGCDNNTKCSEVEHAVNRRAEFNVIIR
ncbi:MAG: OmpA family protein [Marinoscillum sp.]|uniref:OmpA family protein n=1 Tax=Marinoscillum sp. TaxID=2024838 RepID=UPI0032FF25FF